MICTGMIHAIKVQSVWYFLAFWEIVLNTAVSAPRQSRQVNYFFLFPSGWLAGWMDGFIVHSFIRPNERTCHMSWLVLKIWVIQQLQNRTFMAIIMPWHDITSHDITWHHMTSQGRKNHYSILLLGLTLCPCHGCQYFFIWTMDGSWQERLKMQWGTCSTSTSTYQ